MACIYLLFPFLEQASYISLIGNNKTKEYTVNRYISRYTERTISTNIYKLSREIYVILKYQVSTDPKYILGYTFASINEFICSLFIFYLKRWAKILYITLQGRDSKSTSRAVSRKLVLHQSKLLYSNVR